jgi:hypothetical protein
MARTSGMTDPSEWGSSVSSAAVADIVLCVGVGDEKGSSVIPWC